MGAIKLTKIGNSQGVTLPKEILEQGNFTLGDQLEVHVYNGRLILFKKPIHHSQMNFDGDNFLSKEEQEWVNADLGEWDKNA